MGKVNFDEILKRRDLKNLPFLFNRNYFAEIKFRHFAEKKFYERKLTQQMCL